MQSVTISKKRLELIEPLEKWDILGLTELYSMSGSKASFSSFCRIIKRMEQDRLISTFSYPKDDIKKRRKFVHLTKGAHFELLGTEKPYLDINIKIHEAILFNVLRGFLAHPEVGEATPHSKVLFKQRGLMDSSIDTDGVITANIRNESYFIALEIERIQKNSTEIFKKFKEYYSNDYYDIALYMFSNKRVRNRYATYHAEFLKENNINESESMILFSYSENMHEIDFNPMESSLINTSNQEVGLGVFFGKYQ